MTSVSPLHRYTFTDYTCLERDSPIRHEFLNGEIYAMAGGTPEHAALAMAIGSAFLERLRGGPCRVFTSDLRVRVTATGLTTYPDVTVICGPSERDPESPTTITNAKIVVEVTSDGTEHYDRGEKLEHYQRMPSLQAVVIVGHRERQIDVWARKQTGWQHGEARAGERISIDPIDCTIDVDSIYAAAEEPTA